MTVDVGSGIWACVLFIGALWLVGRYMNYVVAMRALELECERREAEATTSEDDRDY